MITARGGVDELLSASPYQPKYYIQRRKARKNNQYFDILSQSEDHKLQKRAKRMKSFKPYESSSKEWENNEQKQGAESRERQNAEQNLYKEMFEGKVNKQNSEVYPQKSGNIQEAAEKMAQEQVRQRRNEWYHRERRKASSVYKQILERARQRSRSKGPRHEKRQKYEREWRKRKREKNPEWRQQQLLRDRERYSKKKIERQKNAEAKRKQQMEHNKDQKHKAHPDQLAKRRQRYKARRKSDPQWAADQREKAKARVQKRRKNEEEEGAAVPKASKAGSYGAQSMQPSKGEAPRGDHAKVGENASQSNKYQTPGRKHTPTSPKTSFTLSNSGLEDHDIDLDEVAGQLAFPPLLPRGFKGFETPDCERNGK